MFFQLEDLNFGSFPNLEIFKTENFKICMFYSLEWIHFQLEGLKRR